jgi:dynein intermediate chain 2
MESQYVYQKKRADFGKHPNFTDRPSELIVDIEPNEDERQNYIVRNPTNIGVQSTHVMSEHEVNTDRFETATKGLYHVEGGWSKDINPTDQEATSRFRKKVEKEESYQKTIVNLGIKVEQIIRQNNAIDVYEEYFTDTQATQLKQDTPTARTINRFHDYSGAERSAIHCSWHPDGGRGLAVAHANLGFQSDSGVTESYVWNVENSNKPETILRPPSMALCLEYNPKDSHVILGGLHSGQVCIWDVRKSTNHPIEVTHLDISHIDPCHSALWIQSKTGTDFFSSSTDGTCKWWDTRNMKQPVEELILDITKKLDKSVALGAICLEYEPTMPTKFMVGTEQGTIITCNRKAKTAADKIAALYQSYSGPVSKIMRNPFNPKYFLTVGEWMARVWSEDIKDSAIICTKNYPHYLTSAAWSPTRPGVFFTTNMNGTLDIWDLMVKHADPTLSVKITDNALRSLRVQEAGCRLAAGDETGNVTLLKLSSALSQLQKDEKSNCSGLLERETRREKVLEAKARELKLKEREKNRPKVVDEEEPSKEEEVDPLQEVNEEFENSLSAESKKFIPLDTSLFE